MERLKQTTETDQITYAEQTTSWLVNKLYSENSEQQDAPLKATTLVTARLSHLFGSGESAEHFEKLPAVFQELPNEHHGNALLYCSGYPVRVIDILADGDIDVTLELLREKALPYRVAAVAPTIEASKPIDLEKRKQLAGRIPIIASVALDAVDISRPKHNEYDEDGLQWRVDALCAETHPEAFFPEKGGSTRDAKRICNSCDVKEQCLNYALDHDERFGIWGGLSERERRKLRKSKNKST